MNCGFLEALARGPILLDSGMGTRLISQGLGQEEASGWNLTRPEIVLETHRRDVEAGSQALCTNTFCATRSWLDKYGLADKVVEINRRGVKLARQAIGPEGLILGSIGAAAQGNQDSLIEQAETLVEAGVDAILLETHPPDEAETSTRLLKGRFGLPIIASLYDWPEAIGETAKRLEDAGASVIGVNCLPSMGSCLAIARKLRTVSGLPLMVKPSTGRLGSFLSSPGSFADAVPELVACGVRLIGGCCGSTEAHVAAMRSALDALHKN